jgi:hypothetical protein
MLDEDVDPEPGTEEHLEFFQLLRARTIELRQTTYAVRTNRRTPAQRQAVRDRSIRAIRRSELIRRRHALLRAVH